MGPRRLPPRTPGSGEEEADDLQQIAVRRVKDSDERTVAERARLGRRRRPSGEPPPLPRHLETSGRLYVALGAAVVILWTGAFYVAPFRNAVTRGDLAVVRLAEDLRTGLVTDLMRAVNGLGGEWAIGVLRWGTVLALVVMRRFRHLFVLVGTILAVTVLSTALAQAISRPRPPGVVIEALWEGFSHPSRPVTALALSLVGILYTLVPNGPLRNQGKWVAAGLVLALGVARVYLGIDHPTDVLVAVVLGWPVPVVAFRLLTPNDVFPVTYRRGRTAHLDVGGRRGEAIRSALEQQMGLRVVDVAPFALAGSAGSTPLRIQVEIEPGEPDTFVFGKLYATSHLRSDRSYKLVRTIRYGRLEDEHSFRSVRALVQYEDYLLRVMRDANLPVAEPYGIVEITPEREYLVVTDFIDGAQEITDAEVDEQVIDDGLSVVRRLWDTGLAHRDVKPANVLVRNGRVLLIDVAFATVRPSPWRQAVDLANMMLVLALRTDSELVYARALRFFTPDEIAEAFAANHSVTVPAELRAKLRADGRDLAEEFCRLAPPRDTISIQRWTLRRLGLTVGVLVGLAMAASLVVANLGALGLR